MPLLPRKPEDREARPQHDQPCKRIAYSDSKTLFAMLMKEASDG